MRCWLVVTLSARSAPTAPPLECRRATFIPNSEPVWTRQPCTTVFMQVPVEGEEDKFYYVNEVTKESSWELPVDSAWVIWHEEL